MVNFIGLLFLFLALWCIYIHQLIGIFLLFLSYVILYKKSEYRVRTQGILGICLLIGVELFSEIINFYGYFPNERIIIAMFLVVIVLISLVLLIRYIKYLIN